MVGRVQGTTGERQLVHFEGLEGRRERFVARHPGQKEFLQGRQGRAQVEQDWIDGEFSLACVLCRV